MNISNSISARRPWLFALVGLAFLLALPLRAQPNALPTGDRYLFVVETSDNMKRRSENVEAFVGSKVASGLDAHMHPPDTIGLWNFDTELYTGQVPAQRWSPETGPRTAALMIDYLHKQFSNKSAELTKPLHAVTELAKKSDRFTVILVTSGADKFSGTPYDAQINEAFRLNGAQQKKSRMPFVTVLRAIKGEFVGFKVSTPPWPVELPPWPPKTNQPPAKVELEPKIDSQPARVETAAPPAAQSNLIVIQPPESKPVPPPAAVETAVTPPAPPPAVATPAPPPEPKVARTIPPVPAETPPASPKIEPPPAVTSQPTASPEPSVAKPLEPKQPDTAQPPAVTSPTPPADSVTAPAKPEKASQAQAATIASRSEPSFKRTLLVGGGALMLGAAILLVALLRKPRKVEKISLITSAVEKED